jgi:hypothetical protein
MNLDFRRLSAANQQRAIQNIIDQYPDHVSYLAYIIDKDGTDVFSWFSFSKSNEGADYWYKLQDTIKNAERNDIKV